MSGKISNQIMEMGFHKLPAYIGNAQPVPYEKRIPWYKSTAPAYFGLFFYPFYFNTVIISLAFCGFKAAFWGLVTGNILAFLFYIIPAIQGMRTGFNAYILTSSCFGTKGAILVPTLLQAVVQIFYYSVKLYLFAYFMTLFAGWDARVGSIPYLIFTLGLFVFSTWLAVAGIRPLATISTLIPPILVFLLSGMALNVGKFATNYSPQESQPLWGFLITIDLVLSYIAAGGVAGADFGSYNRNFKDVILGGGVGILLGGICAGALSLIIVAGINVISGGREFTDLGVALNNQGGIISVTVFLVFALSIVPSTVYSAFLYTNVVATRVPVLSRAKAGIICGAIGLIIALTGVATEFRAILNFLGASFSPVLGVMLSEYLLVKPGKWPGPYPGFNKAGYLAWVLGFIIGILPNPLWNHLFGIHLAYAPANLFSFLGSFGGYAFFTKLGLTSKPYIDMEGCS